MISGSKKEEELGSEGNKTPSKAIRKIKANCLDLPLAVDFIFGEKKMESISVPQVR